jgi:hypothetical protein
MDDTSFPGWRPDKSINVVAGRGITQVIVKGRPYMNLGQ